MPRPRFHLRRKHWLLGVGALVAVAAVVALFYFTELDWSDLHDALLRVNLATLWLLMILLPPCGFSVSVVWLVAGARFGPWLGGAVVAATTAAHLLLMHVIGRRWLRRGLKAWLKKRGHELPAVPAGENLAVTVTAVLAPGLPYFARNYLLAISDVPLRIYFWTALPLYVARSYVTLFIGDLASDPSPRQLAVLGAVYAVKLGVCAYLLWHIRRRLKRDRGAVAAAG